MRRYPCMEKLSGPIKLRYHHSTCGWASRNRATLRSYSFRSSATKSKSERLTGSPFAWAAGHAAWGRHYRGLGVLFTERYDYIANAGFYAYVRDLPTDVLNALGVIFVLVSVWPVWR